MADTLTYRSDVTNADTQTFYDETLLRRAHPYEVHANHAQQRPMPANKGDTVLFRRYEHLSLATTPLSEGTTPDGQAMSKTDIKATPLQYGDYIHITDVVDLQARDPVLTEAAELLGEQMGKTRDVIVRDAILQEYVDNVGTGDYDKADGGNDQLAQEDIETAMDNLLTANARFITSSIRPSTGYNTVPIRPAYIAIMHPKFRTAVEAMSDFTPVSQYPSNENILDGEWGAVLNVRIVFTTLADDADGSSGSSLYGATNDNPVIPVFGSDAYGVTEITGGSATNIVKSEGGTSDPLNQRQTSGWKLWMTAKILNPKFMTLIRNVTK